MPAFHILSALMLSTFSTKGPVMTAKQLMVDVTENISCNLSTMFGMHMPG